MSRSIAQPPIIVNRPSALVPLTKQQRWVLFQLVEGKNGKLTKVPHRVDAPDKLASSTNPETWGDFAAACRALKKGLCDGIGFVLTGSEYAAVDLDHVLDDNEKIIVPQAAEMVAQAEREGLYVEVTPSGHGLRIIGVSDGTGLPKQNLSFHNGAKAEFYRGTPRYITMTGDVYGQQPKTLGNVDGLINRWIRKKVSNGNGNGQHHEVGDKDKTRSGQFFKLVMQMLEQGSDLRTIRKDILKRTQGKWGSTNAAELIEAGHLDRHLGLVVDKFEARKRIIDGAVDSELPPLDIKWSGDFIRDFVPPDFVIKGVFQRRYLYSLTGHPGRGKTAITLLVALRAAQGKRIGDHETKKCRVLYLAAENPDDIRVRWVGLCEAHKLEDSSLDPDKLKVAFFCDVVNLDENFDRFEQAAKALGGFDLVIVDTSRAFFAVTGGKENENQDMTRHGQSLRRLTTLEGAPCVLVNCHPTKHATNDDMIPAGGGGFWAEIDGNVAVIEENGFLVMKCTTKHRGVYFAPMPFDLTERMTSLKTADGDPVYTVVARALTTTGYETQLAKTTEVTHLILQHYNDHPESSLAEVAEVVYGDKTKKPLVQRKINKLVETKLLEKAISGRYQLGAEGRKWIADMRKKAVTDR